MSLISKLTSLNHEIEQFNTTLTTMDSVIANVDCDIDSLNALLEGINIELETSLGAIKATNATYHTSLQHYNTHLQSSMQPKSKTQYTQTDEPSSRFEMMYEELKHDAAPVVENLLWTTIKRLVCMCLL